MKAGTSDPAAYVDRVHIVAAAEVHFWREYAQAAQHRLYACETALAQERERYLRLLDEHRALRDRTRQQPPWRPAA